LAETRNLPGLGQQTLEIRDLHRLVLGLLSAEREALFHGRVELLHALPFEARHVLPLESLEIVFSLGPRPQEKLPQARLRNLGETFGLVSRTHECVRGILFLDGLPVLSEEVGVMLA